MTFAEKDVALQDVQTQEGSPAMAAFSWSTYRLRKNLRHESLQGLLRSL